MKTDDGLDSLLILDPVQTYRVYLRALQYMALHCRNKVKLADEIGLTPRAIRKWLPRRTSPYPRVVPRPSNQLRLIRAAMRRGFKHDTTPT